MKKEIEKFLDDNELAISGISVVAGITAAAISIYLLMKNNGNSVVRVFSGTDVAPGSIVYVQLKNGQVLDWIKDAVD